MITYMLPNTSLKLAALAPGFAEAAAASKRDHRDETSAPQEHCALMALGPMRDLTQASRR